MEREERKKERRLTRRQWTENGMRNKDAWKRKRRKRKKMN